MHRPPASADISIASALSFPSGMTTFFVRIASWNTAGMFIAMTMSIAISIAATVLLLLVLVPSLLLS